MGEIGPEQGEMGSLVWEEGEPKKEPGAAGLFLVQYVGKETHLNLSQKQLQEWRRGGDARGWEKCRSHIAKKREVNPSL